MEEAQMNLLSLVLVAVGLAMDACAVSICKGLSRPPSPLKRACTLGLFFGFFQGAMPLIGYYLGRSFASSIESIDHWVAFILLAFIGGKMIWEALKKEDDTDKNRDDYRIQTLTLLSLATSIDALAVGVTFAFLQVSIVPAVLLIAAVTFVLTLCGFWLGTVFGAKLQSKAELFGGVILVLIGLKILLEHLGVF